VTFSPEKALMTKGGGQALGRRTILSPLATFVVGYPF
jgi:hypothetical protein